MGNHLSSNKVLIFFRTRPLILSSNMRSCTLPASFVFMVFLKKIVSDRGPQFVAHFWRSLHEAMETDLTYSTAYHPQTDGQAERVNQILEDMLRALCSHI